MASSPINLWQIEGENVKVVTDFSFFGFKITVEVIPAMKSEDDCFLTGKQWQTLTVCLKAETLLCQQSPSSQGYGLPSDHIQL